MPNDDTIRRILAMKTIAVVGLSPKEERPSNGVARYLIAQGYQVIPVNPGHDTILEQKSYPTLADIPVPVDVVDVFRRSELVPPVAQEAAAIGAKALWLQLGIGNDEAAALAEQKGMLFVQNRCIKIEHARFEGG